MLVRSFVPHSSRRSTRRAPYTRASMSRIILVAPLLGLLTAPLAAQQGTLAGAPTPSTRRPTLAADWAKWETLGNGDLSPDGVWIAYDFRRANGTGELRFRKVESDSEQVVRNGTGAAFSSNSRWLVYTITPDTAGGGRAGRGGRGDSAGTAPLSGTAPPVPRNKVGIVNLRSGVTTLLEDVQSFTMSKDGRHVALRRYSATGRVSRGVDLVVRDLEQGSDVTLGNVADYAWSDDGAMLAMTIDVDGKTGNSLQLLHASTGSIRSLDASDAHYTTLLVARAQRGPGCLSQSRGQCVRRHELHRHRVANGGRRATNQTALRFRHGQVVPGGNARRRIPASAMV